MLKKSIRAAIRMTKNWLAEEENENRNYDEDLFLYPWLNSMFRRVIAEADIRSHVYYAWGVLQGVNLAKAISASRVSVIEFGVAGGNGLIALERIAEKVESLLGITIDVYGFDTGVGLPKPKDHRDLPNLWQEGYFPTDKEKLQKRLKRAQLVWGLVGDTIAEFINSKPSPVAFISFDLDLYSSTVQAFKLLAAEQNLLLPRIHCYFDDIMGFTYGDHNGERLAISEFNTSNSMRKISKIYGLGYYLDRPYTNTMWAEKYYMAHILDHDLYARTEGLVTKTGAERATERI